MNRTKSSALATKTGVGVATTLIAANSPAIFFAAYATLLLITIGVLLPAVWSSRKERRHDAQSILRMLLRHLATYRSG